MFARKFMAAILGLGLTCGGASLVYADGESVNLFDVVSDNYVQMCKDPDLRHCCLMRITDSTDESFVLRYEDYMLRNPELFKRDLISKLSKDEKFRENYLTFLKICEEYKDSYKEFMSKGPAILKHPPSWGW